MVALGVLGFAWKRLSVRQQHVTESDAAVATSRHDGPWQIEGLARRAGAALDRESGEFIGEWTAKDPDKHRVVGSYVTLLLDQGQLLVAANVYTYWLDPLTGTELWANPLRGWGLGPAALATSTAASSQPVLAAAAAQQQTETGTTAGLMVAGL